MSKEDLLFKSIEIGDINYFENNKFNPSIFNQFFYQSDFYIIKTPSKKCCFTSIKNVTPIVACILSEQDKLLEYLIDNFQPDLSIKCNGWAPLHFSCCTGSYKCLKILLKYPYIQENIDAYIDFPFTKEEGFGTTALHIAVTNKCHAQALLLTNELPTLADGSSYQSANPIQQSFSGNTPLHIAAFNNDWDMCQIILNANDDCTILNSDGFTPLRIAKSKGFDDLQNKLLSESTDSNEDLLRKYLNKEDYETRETAQDTTENEKLNVDIIEEEIDTLTTQIQMLNARLSALSN